MSENYILSFGRIIKLQDNLAEVIVNKDVEFNTAMIDEYHTWLLENLSAPFALLINKINPYTYTFDAQLNIANLPGIRAMAILAYSRVTEESTNVLISMPRKNKWNVRQFHLRANALSWLNDELA